MGYIRHMNYIEHEDEVAFHPGYYLIDAINGTGYTFQEFSKRSGISEVDLACIICGELDVNDDKARGLSKVLGTSKEYWNNIQKKYNVKKEEWKDENI